MDTFKTLVDLLLPPGGLIVLACLGIILRRRLPRTAIFVGLLSIGLFLLMSMPILGWWLEKGNPKARYLPEPWPEAEAIVVLGGGRRWYAIEYGVTETANAGTLERVRYAAYVAKKTKKPILASGGKPLGGKLSEAEIMADILKQEYGVEAKWIEPESRDTQENARLSSRILQQAGVKRIYVVTHADHMPRAKENFEANGMVVVPLATGFVPENAYDHSLWLPSFRGLVGNRWTLQTMLSYYLW